MSRESTLYAGRLRAAEAFRSTIRWERKSGLTAQDETTGAESPGFTFIYEGPCKIAVGALKSLVPTVKERVEAGGEVTELRSVIHMPVDAPALNANDMGTVTAVAPFSDESLIGRRYRVVGPIAMDYATARRFSVEEIMP